MTRHKKEPRYFLIGGQGGDDTEPEQVLEGEYVVRDIPKATEETIPGTTEPSKPTILPQISDAQIDMLYSMMAVIDSTQSKFSGSKREYVLKMYELMSTYMTQQAMNGVGVFPRLQPKLSGKGRLIGGFNERDHKAAIEAGIAAWVNDYVNYPDDKVNTIHDENFDTMQSLESEPGGRDTLKYINAFINTAIANNVRIMRKQVAKAKKLEPETEPEAVEPPSKKDASLVFLNTFKKTVETVFGPKEIDKTYITELVTRSTLKSKERAQLKMATGSDFAKQITDNLAAVKFGVKKAVRTIVDEEQKTSEVNIIGATIQEHIEALGPQLLFRDISEMTKMFELFVTGLVESIRSKEHASGPDFDTLFVKKLLNFTLYPALTDFNYISGVGSLCRRFIIGGQKFNGEQGKVGEFYMRSQVDWMDSFMFLNDKYDLAATSFNQSMIESDSCDLQEFKPKGDGYLTYLGEIKTFSPVNKSGKTEALNNVTVQYTKMVLFVTMLSEYEKARAEAAEGRTYQPQITLNVYDTDEKRTLYFPELGKDGKYPYVPFVVNVFNLLGCTQRKNVQTADAIPIRLVYDALKMAEDMKRLTFPDGTTMFDKIRSHADKYVFISRNSGRIYRPKQVGDPEKPFFTAYRDAWNDDNGSKQTEGDFVLSSREKVSRQVRDVSFTYAYLHSTGNHLKSHAVNKRIDGKPTKAYNTDSLTKFVSRDRTDIVMGQRNLLSLKLLDDAGYGTPEHVFTPKEFRDLYKTNVSEQYYTTKEKFETGTKAIKPPKEWLATVTTGEELPPAPFDKFAEWLKAPRDGLKPDGEKDLNPATESDSRDVKNSVVSHKNIIELMKSYHTDWLTTLPKDEPVPTIDYFYQWLKDNKLNKKAMPAQDAPEGLYWYTPRKYERVEVDESSYFDFGSFRYKVAGATIPQNPKLTVSTDILRTRLEALLSSAMGAVKRATNMSIDITTTEPYKRLQDYIIKVETVIDDTKQDRYTVTPLIAHLGSTTSDAYVDIDARKAAKRAAAIRKAKEDKAAEQEAEAQRLQEAKAASKAKIQKVPEAAAAAELFPLYNATTKLVQDKLVSYNALRPQLNALQQHPIPLNKEEEEKLKELSGMVTPAMLSDQERRRAFMTAANTLLKEVDTRRTKEGSKTARSKRK